jgi:hypothetical protein
MVESGVEYHRPKSNPVIQKLEDLPINPFIFKKYDTRMYMLYANINLVSLKNTLIHGKYT